MEFRRPQQKTKREVRKNRRKYIITTLLLIFVFSDFVWIMNHPQFKVTNIEIEGNKTILSEDIENEVKGYLDTKMFWLFPRDNVFVLNTKKIENKINTTYPKIYSTKASIEKGTIVSLQIEEREPHSLWCKNENYESNFDEECFFADQKGYIYTRSPYFSEGVFQKIYTPDETLHIGTQVVNKDDFEDFFKFINSLNESYDINLERIFINPSNEVRLYINNLSKTKIDKKPYIIYRYGDSYELLHRNIGLMIHHNLFKKDFSEKPQRLEFIDLRIPDQIRYKFTPIGETTNDEKITLIEHEKKTETTE